MLTLLMTGFGVQAAAPDFEREVAPILVTRCLECHQGKPSGDLRLTTASGFNEGGKSGKPLREHLLERVVAGEMPPEKQGRSQRLPDAEINVLRRWITTRADWPRLAPWIGLNEPVAFGLVGIGGLCSPSIDRGFPFSRGSPAGQCD